MVRCWHIKLAGLLIALVRAEEGLVRLCYTCTVSERKLRLFFFGQHGRAAYILLSLPVKKAQHKGSYGDKLAATAGCCH